MSRLLDRLYEAVIGSRDVIPAPTRMVGFPVDGGLVGSGVTATTALGLSAVWRCLDILSNGVSQLPWQDMLGNLIVPPSPIVRRPQNDYTRREWTSLVVSTLALYDIQYSLKVGADDEGVPLSLVYLQPGVVMPITSAFGNISLLPPQEYWVGQERKPASDLVILRRSPQPGISEDMGGIIRLARISFAAAIAAEGYASRYWQAGGSPTVVLESDGAVPDPIAKQTADRWTESRRLGPDHPAVLGSGLKAKDFGADPTQQAAVEARREQVADVGRYFGVPTRILNAPTGDTETYATSESANQDLVRYTLQNYIGAVEDAITDLLPAGRHMQMDTGRLTRSTQLAQAQTLQILTGGKAVMDVDEARDVLSLPPVEDPDTLNPPAAVPAGPGGLTDGRE